jgi:xylulokinase
MWSDRRGAPFAARTVGGRIAGWAPDVLLRGLRFAGTVPLPTGECPLGHELWLRHGQPDVYARSAVLLEPVDYLGLRFSGRAAATPASMWMSAVVDTRPGRPARYVPSLVRRYGRDPARLPELVPTGSVLGGVLPSVADELGVRPEAPVVCGVPDQHAAYVGSGATQDFLAHLVVSTTSWQSCRIPFRRMDPIRLLTSIPAIEADSYLVFSDQASAGYCLAWWTDRLAEAAHHAGGKPPDYSQTLELAAAAAPGSGGVLFLPWLRGERTPADDRTARGGFVNVSAHSALADLLARPVGRVADPWFAQVRGAALLALVGLGEATVDQAASRVRVSERFLPALGSAEVYDPLFTEFTGLFASLRPHHRRLNAEAAPP